MSKAGYLGGKQASEALGVHQRTLYTWEQKGYIETVRTNGGKRLYNVQKYLSTRGGTKEAKVKICYVRVSSRGQKDDLDRQVAYMSKKYPKHILIKDIGSGLNMNRKGLLKIIDYAINGDLKELVIAHKDRLARFGYPLIEHMITKYSGGKIVVVDREKEKSPDEELVEDVLQVMNVFVAKINGRRKYKI